MALHRGLCWHPPDSGQCRQRQVYGVAHRAFPALACWRYQLHTPQLPHGSLDRAGADVAQPRQCLLGWVAVLAMLISEIHQPHQHQLLHWRQAVRL